VQINGKWKYCFLWLSNSVKNGQKMKNVFKQTTGKLFWLIFAKSGCLDQPRLLRLRECASSKILNLWLSIKSQKKVLQTCWNSALCVTPYQNLKTKITTYTPIRQKVNILNASFGYLQNQRSIEEKSSLLKEEKNSR